MRVPFAVALDLHLFGRAKQRPLVEVDLRPFHQPDLLGSGNRQDTDLDTARDPARVIV